MQSRCDVLVVGAGPTGLTLASELLRRGLTVRLIDKAAAPTTLSKAIAVHARTLEIFSDLGIAAELEARGVRLVGATLTAQCETLVEVDFAVLDSRFPYVLSVAQSETEAVLSGLVVRRGGRVERETELLRLSQDHDGVTATLRSPDGEESVDARWIVGCDGAHSTVRHAIGGTFEGHGYDDTFVLADVRMEAGLPIDRITTFFAEDGLVACFPMADRRWRIIVTATESTPREPTVADVERIVASRSGKPVTMSDPQWIAPFRIHCRQVEQYRDGRVFLAGDAAHIHSPAGGQGMNTGIQDAHNLAWKLAYVARHGGRDVLLESYGAERHAIGKALLRTTDIATRLGTLRSAPAIGVRNLVASFLTGFEPVRRRIAHALAELDVGYFGSILGKDLSSLSSRPTHQATRPGSFAFDAPGLSGEAFTVIADAARAEVVGRHLRRHGDAVRVLGFDPASKLARHADMDDDTVLVVRPDLYIGARASLHQLEDVGAYLDSLFTGSPGAA